jgi:hypothetical protein
VQVDPIKPKFKPPGAKRLNLKCGILLSTSAFKFNLRCYGEAMMIRVFKATSQFSVKVGFRPLQGDPMSLSDPH